MNSASIFDSLPRRYVWDDPTRFYMAFPEEIPDHLLPQYGYLLLKRKAVHVELNSKYSINNNERAVKRRKIEVAPPARGYRYLDYDRGLKEEARRRRRAMRRLASGTRYVPEPMDIDGPEVSRLMVAEVPIVFGGDAAAEEEEAEVVVEEKEEDVVVEEEGAEEEEEEDEAEDGDEDEDDADEAIEVILKSSFLYEESGDDDDDDDFLAGLSLPGSDA